MGFLETILGIDLSGADGASGWTIDWTSWPEEGAARVAIIVGLIVLCWGIHKIYAKDAGHLRARTRSLLTILRILVFACVGIMFLEPVLVMKRTEERPSNLLILEDRSASTDLADAAEDPDRAARLAARFESEPERIRRMTRQELGRLAVDTIQDDLAAGGDRIVRRHPFADRFVLEPPADGSLGDASRSFTALGGALEQALAAYRGPPLAGVLVVTDGRSNTGPSPVRSANLAGGAGLPVHVLGIGSDREARNGRVTSIDTPPVAFIRDPIELHVHVEGRGVDSETGDLVIERRVNDGAWEPLARKDVRFDEDGKLVRVSVIDKHDKPVEVEYRATLGDLGKETNDDDNVGSARVKVVRQKIRTLLVAGLAFPEVQFLINTLMRDPGVDLSSWLMFADPDYKQKGNTVITRLPLTEEELDRFDCVILYDPDLRELPSNFTGMLNKFVGEKGGGLIFIAGESATSEIFDRTVPGADDILPLLPVIREPGLFTTRVEMRLSSSKEWRLSLTPAGIADDLFRFDEDHDKNRRIIKGLPGVYWHFQVTREKPGATVLARHGDERMSNQYGRHVVMASQFFGPGRVIFLGWDSSYRWRYLSEQLFDGFWARLNDRVGRPKMLGGQLPIVLSTDRTEYEPNDLVTVNARFRNPSDRTDAVSSLAGEVEFGDGEKMELRLTPSSEDADVFSATFRVPKGGRHNVRVWPALDQQPGVRAATIPVVVSFPDRELLQPALDRATLTAMAEASNNGRVFSLDQIDEIAAAFKIGRVGITHEDRQEMWDAPVVWMLLFVWLFAEWVLRKRWRMV